MTVDYPYADEVADRAGQARQAQADMYEPCSCNHQEDDHTPGNGCEHRWCCCGWWGP